MSQGQWSEVASYVHTLWAIHSYWSLDSYVDILREVQGNQEKEEEEVRRAGPVTTGSATGKRMAVLSLLRTLPPLHT